MKFFLKIVAACIAGLTPFAATAAAGLWCFNHNLEFLQWTGFVTLLLTGGVAGYFLASSVAD
jgi:hypothetical protein